MIVLKRRGRVFEQFSARGQKYASFPFETEGWVHVRTTLVRQIVKEQSDCRHQHKPNKHE